MLELVFRQFLWTTTESLQQTMTEEKRGKLMDSNNFTEKILKLKEIKEIKQD